MAITWEDLTKEDAAIIDKCLLRAVELLGKHVDRLSLHMDISAAHLDRGLKLQELLDAPDSAFLHDVVGITTNINRITGELDKTFEPVFHA